MIQFSARAIVTFGCTFAIASVATAQSASLTAGGYTAPFSSFMQDTGTSPPLGWTHLTLAGSSTTFTAATGIPAASITGGTASTGLTPMLDPTATNNNGYNAATSAAPTVRSIGTCPTGVAASVLEIRLTNNTGAAQTQLSLSYDTRRFSAGGSGDSDLPGYQVFFSLDNGTTYQNVPALNPVISGSGTQVVVPNTTGLTTVNNFALSLPTQFTVGSDIYLRFVDDNDQLSSPDQVLGLERFVIAPVPEPSTVLAGSAVVLWAVRRLHRGSTPQRAA